MKPLIRALLALCFLVLVGGCATYVPGTQAAAFNQAATAAASTLQASLTEIQAVEVENQVEGFAQGGERTLEHLDLAPKLSDNVAKAIESQFGFLVTYSAALKALTAPGSGWNASVSSLNTAAGKVATDAGALAGAVGEATLLSTATAQTLKTDSGNVANALSTVGQGFLTLYGEEKAYRIAAAADPAVQRYCTALEAILTEDPPGAAPKTGLAGILQADYEVQVAVLKLLATTAVPPHGDDDPNYLTEFQARSNLVKDYTALRQSEQAGVGKIVALRQAVAAIAAAHAALAKKDDETFRQELAAASALLETAFKSSPNAPAPASP